MQCDAVLFLGIVLSALMLPPLWMLISGIKHKGRIRMMVGGACFVVVFAFGVFLVDSFCPRHERILDHGTTPDGREYALIQLNNGEPYNLELFVRNGKGDWVFNYVDHEIWPIRSGAYVGFSDDAARVFCGNKLFKTVEIYPKSYEGSAGSYPLPAELSVEALFRRLQGKTLPHDCSAGGLRPAAASERSR